MIDKSLSNEPILPDLPLSAWNNTKVTLHLYLQIVGKIRMALAPKKNHWWHVPLYITSRGLTTGPIPYGYERAFEIQLDFMDHSVIVNSSTGGRETFALTGQKVADFYCQLFDSLRRLDIEVTIKAEPFDHESDIPFPKDDVHGAYNAHYVERFWQILLFTQIVFSEFGSRFAGKTTPVHLFWHSFDLAMTWFSGRKAPKLEGAGQVAREAYSHEVISFGFWPGDATYTEPAFYSYTWPEPEGLRVASLKTDGAFWTEKNGSALAVLPYEKIRTAENPVNELISFLESAFEAGARLGGWDMENLLYEYAGSE